MDIYAEVTDRIIKELEAGIIPWDKPWSGVSSGAISHSTGKPYSLINQILLGKAGEYITFNQCKTEGGKVRKGAKSKMVVFWKMILQERKDEAGQTIRDENGLPMSKSIPMLRYYNVFHIDDCEGIKAKYGDEEMPNIAKPVEEAEFVIKDYSTRAHLTVEHRKQDRAYYSPKQHLVSLPLMEQFVDTAEYYSATFHELTHSTGHKSLLDRFTEESGIASFASESYSKEELIAEIGACAILHEMGMETKQSFRNSAGYIQGWLKALQNDKRLIISAASRAEKAIKLILGVETEEDKE